MLSSIAHRGQFLLGGECKSIAYLSDQGISACGISRTFPISKSTKNVRENIKIKMSSSNYIIVIVGIALWALIPGFIAKKKGQNFWIFYFLSFLITPLLTMIIAACFIKSANESGCKNEDALQNGQGSNIKASRKTSYFATAELCFTGVMAAIIYVVTLFRFPFLGSMVHFANAMCLLAGMLFGSASGGLAAGIGSALYDAFHGYDFVNIVITFVSKFMMAWVCAKVLRSKSTRSDSLARTVIAAVCGALTYVALYMLKTFIYQAFVYGFPMSTVWATMLSKFIPSIINAGVAIVAAPILYRAVLPALRRIIDKGSR